MDFLYELRKRAGLTTPEQDADHYDRQNKAGEAVLRGVDVQPSLISKIGSAIQKPLVSLGAAYESTEADTRANQAAYEMEQEQYRQSLREQSVALRDELGRRTNPYHMQGLRTGVSGEFPPKKDEERPENALAMTVRG